MTRRDQTLLDRRSSLSATASWGTQNKELVRHLLESEAAVRLDLEKSDGLLGVLDGNDFAGLGSDGHALGDELETLGLGGVLGGVVLLDALEEGLVAATLADVLDANVDALAELSAADDLRHLHADRVLGHVEHDSRAAVVVLVRHTLVDRRVSVDVHIVALLEGDQVPTHVRHTLRAERLAELLSCLGPETEMVGHRTV